MMRNSYRWTTFTITILAVLGSLITLNSLQGVNAQSAPLTFQMSLVDAVTGSVKSSFYLGEQVSVVFSVSNQSGVPQTITTLEQAEIGLRLTGAINRGAQPLIIESHRGGTGSTADGPDGSVIFLTQTPSNTTLAPGQTVQVRIDDLASFFGTRLDDGSYTLKATYSPSLQVEKTFTVAIDEARTVPLLQQLASGQDTESRTWANFFLALIQKPSISGRITSSSGSPLKDVTINVTGPDATNIENRPDGKYDLTRLTLGGNYTLTPSLQGYTFEPVTRAFNNLTAKQVDANFIATKALAGEDVALRSAGAVVTASSTFDDDYRPEGVINGSTFGDWGTGTGGWQDGTPNVFPDWIQIDFGAPRGIDWINVYTLQDNFENSTEPTLTETFTLYGITDFDVQYWDGTTWITVPGGEVNGNNKVWRKFSFPTITTSKIRVFVRNAMAGHSRITEIEAFHVNQPPTVSIPGTIQGAPGTPIQFSSTATDSDGTITSYDWDFGDNSTGTGPNPSHVYAAAGTYNVTLTVTDDSGETAVATKTVNISGPPQTPVAKPGGSYNGFPGTSIVFDGRASFDPDGIITSYQWDFGDNTSAPGAAPSHSYSQPGIYTARLTVTDNSGSIGTATTTATIATNQPPPSDLDGVTWCLVHLHWVDNSSDETAFLVELSQDGGQTYSTVRTLPPNSVEALSLPRPGANSPDYYYRVRAANAQGVSAPSNTYVAVPLCNGCSCDSGTPNFGPTVIMTAPASGTIVAAWTNVSLVAQVSSGNGIASVKFYQGNTLIGNGVLVSPPTTPPSYSFTWAAVPAGTYSLTATATDNSGRLGTSAPVTLVVAVPPTVSITTPANNSRFTPPANIAITATAAGTNATISNVEFFQGSTKIGEDNTAPYSIAWSNVGSGTYQLTAKATDSNNLSTISTPITAVVNAAPTVSLIMPAPGQQFSSPGTVTLGATASDSDGTISKVDFYQGSTLVGTDTTSPYTFTWTNVATGNYSITARATDNLGDTGTSTPISITVNNLPTASITSPANGTVVNAPANISIAASAADNDGTISKVEFYQGAVKLGEDTTAPYTFNWTNVAAGSYTLTARATDNLGGVTTSSPVSIIVNTLPTVSLTMPAPGQQFSSPGTVTLGATASDSDGTITKVDFYQGSTLLGTDTTSPYTFTWINVPTGVYSITARATDNVGEVTISSAVSITVNNSPAVSIFSPAGGTVFNAPATIGITATASDNDGTISKVEFYQGAVKLGEDTTAPYTFNWTNVAAGSYSLTAKATDNLGAITSSTAVGVTVNDPPTVSITNPTSGSMFNAPGSITIYANAADSDGTVSKVDFYQGSTLIGTVTAAPWAMIWANVSAGNYNLTAKATDNRGVTTTSSAVNVIVNSPPTISITSPANNSTFAQPASAVISVSVSDPDGTISKVEFFDGSTKLGETLSAPFSFNWNPIAAGTHSVTAKATDNRGATTTSASITIVVSSVVRTNFALSSQGGFASASSSFSLSYTATSTNNGDRKGTNWGLSGGGWYDASPGVFPDWVQIDFNGSKSIDEINVFTLQDNFGSPVEPTETMTFTNYGVTAFDVQYWTGTAWVTVPGGSVTNNNKVWRKVTFTSITTTKIRILVNASADGGSRLTEVEAWGVPEAPPTNVALAANGGTASASSLLALSFSASSTINGDRRGANFGSSGGGWADASSGSFPDWLQIDFSGNKTINQVNVITLQDDFPNAVEPTETMTFAQYGLSAYDVQYWNGTAWVTVPGGSITGNNKVWRKITFANITTSKIRVLTNAAIDNGYSRLVEVEAWGPN
jgi:PKD repeat protein